MDLQTLMQRPPTSLPSLAQYIITVFFPSARPLLNRYPTIFRFLAFVSTIYYLSPLIRLQQLWNRFSSLFTSTITIKSDDDLFFYLTTYMGTLKAFRTDQTLFANTNTSVFYDNGLDLFPVRSRRTRGSSNVSFENSQCLTFFVHRRRLFFFARRNTTGTPYNGRQRISSSLSISTLGRDPQPIKDFLCHIYESQKSNETVTIIRRPTKADQYVGSVWKHVASKPCRSLTTVVLGAKQKATIVKDVARYLSPDMKTFYLTRGIPYRRGYLFYGPPGTGKTSLAQALAGSFGLDIHIMSLLELKGDKQLNNLVSKIPGNSVLLLEDVDAVGLNRNNEVTSKAIKEKNGKGEESPGESSSTQKKENGPVDGDEVGQFIDDSYDSDYDKADDDSAKTKITLSGLLNAIDGIGAPEGHILIMTTNRPEDLDDALIRAGRISVRIEFEKASREVAEGMFLKMYLASQTPNTDNSGTSADSEKPVESSNVSTVKAGPDITIEVKLDCAESESDIRTMASEFASNIDEREFSPADLQDYFLMRLWEPRQALEDIAILREDMKKEEARKELAAQIKQSKLLATAGQRGSKSSGTSRGGKNNARRRGPPPPRTNGLMAMDDEFDGVPLPLSGINPLPMPLYQPPLPRSSHQLSIPVEDEW